MVAAATAWAEGIANRAFVDQQWLVTLPGFPACGEIRLPLGRCLAVQKVEYRDAAGAWQTLTGPTTSPIGTGYEEVLAGHTGAFLYPPLTGTWPATAGGAKYAVRVTARFGYGNASAVPADIKQAILCRTADMWEGRGPDDKGWTQAAELLLAPYRVPGVVNAARE